MFRSLSSSFSSPPPPAAATTMDKEIVTVDVQPGPLGILLDGKDKTRAAVLEGFAPIDADGNRGPIERDGRVLAGSALVGVNEYDFVETAMSFNEITRVLRDTGHLPRTLHFEVPVTIASNKKTVAVAASSSSPLSPRQPEPESDDLHNNNNNKRPMASSSFQEIDESEVAAALTSPTRRLTLSPLSHSGNNQDPMPAELTMLTVEAPAGPLGLNLDGSSTDVARVLGFVPLPDGSTGALELHGGVRPGSLLVEINGEDVSTWPLSEILGRLGALADSPRRLGFLLPDAATVAAMEEEAARAAAAAALARAPSSAHKKVTYVEDLDKRRKLELSLVMKFDTTTLKRRECWFMIDATWMAHWVSYAARGSPLPGPITNHMLLEDDWEAKLRGEVPGRADAPRPGLEITKDYRAVSPMVWSLFVELHGVSGGTPVLARYLLDIYAEPLHDAEVSAALNETRLKASSIVSELRENCQVQVLE